MQTHSLPGSQGSNTLKGKVLEQQRIKRDAYVPFRRSRGTTTEVPPSLITCTETREQVALCTKTLNYSLFNVT